MYGKLAQWLTFRAVNHDYMESYPDVTFVFFFLLSCLSSLRMFTRVCLLTTVATSVRSTLRMLAYLVKVATYNLLIRSGWNTRLLFRNVDCLLFLTQWKFYAGEKSNVKKTIDAKRKHVSLTGLSVIFTHNLLLNRIKQTFIKLIIVLTKISPLVVVFYMDIQCNFR